MKHTKKMHCRSAIVIIIATLIYSSCIDEGEETIVLPIPQGKIPYSFIAEELQDSLRSNGFTIYEGVTPPDIEGVFVASPMTLHYASDGYINNFYDLYMTMSDQKMRGLITYSERQRDTVEGNSIYAHVVGHDSCFTMYCFQNLSEYSGSEMLWQCKIATVVSGIVTPTGFRDFQYSYIMLDKEASTDYYYSQLAALNSFRIFDDGDHMAIKIR